MPKPKVILIAAVSLDGRIAQHPGQSSLDWTSKEDREWFQNASREIGTLIMGRKTFATINKALPKRRTIVLTTSPEDYSSLVKAGQLEFTAEPIRKLLARLAREGVASVLVAGGAQVYSQFLRQNFVDEVWLTLEAHIFGGGVSLCELKTPPVNLKMKRLKRIGADTVLLQYETKSLT
jgi:dihydrofolate reductase